jgi:hypothetical protein
VIDLPGGSGASYVRAGVGHRFPRIELRVPPQFSLDPVLVSATVRNVAASGCVRCGCVKSPDGAWRRYEMTMLRRKPARSVPRRSSGRAEPRTGAVLRER